MITPVASPQLGDAGPQFPQHQKLVAAAQHFEAMFLQEMMKSFAPDSDESSDAAGEIPAGTSTYQSLGVESMASAISRAGGLGIARSVVASVEGQQRNRLEHLREATHD